MGRMDRITMRLPNGKVKCARKTGDDIMPMLAAYEDTGLTPEETAALRAEVERLRATYEAPPMPLTADDLAQMEGEPVYVRYGDGREGWDHVENGMPIWLEADPDFLNLTCSFDKDGHFGLHLLGWQAFRTKPTANVTQKMEDAHGKAKA